MTYKLYCYLILNDHKRPSETLYNLLNFTYIWETRSRDCIQIPILTFDDERFDFLGLNLQLGLNHVKAHLRMSFCQLHEREQAHLLHVLLVTEPQRLDELAVVLVEAHVAGQVLRDEHGQQVVDELALQEAYGLEGQQRVQQEGVGVLQCGDYAADGVLASVGSVLGGVGA